MGLANCMLLIKAEQKTSILHVVRENPTLLDLPKWRQKFIIIVIIIWFDYGFNKKI